MMGKGDTDLVGTDLVGRLMRFFIFIPRLTIQGFLIQKLYLEKSMRDPHFQFLKGISALMFAKESLQT